jgi:threonine dehydrogenase-like Zn-dependent dehydrogenase
MVGPRDVQWSTVDLSDRLGAGCLRLRSRVSLISPGTELRLYRGDAMATEVWESFSDLDQMTNPLGLDNRYRVTQTNAPADAIYPVAFGYNNVAEIVEVGEGVEGFAVGDRVMTLARHQEMFDLFAWEPVAIPSGVSDEAAAFSYIATLGLHALRRARFQPGENVAVIGLGLVGLCASLVADAVGARLICVDISPERLRHAATALPGALVHDAADDGFAAALERALDPDGVDVVLEAAGGPQALDLGMRILDRTGRMVGIALHPEDVGTLLSADFYEKETAVIGASNDPYDDPQARRSRFTIAGNVAYMLDLQQRGRIALESVRTHTFPADEVGPAYAALAAGQRDMIGVLLDWR